MMGGDHLAQGRQAVLAHLSASLGHLIGPRAGDPGRHADGRDHAAMIGFALACDIEGGAVIGEVRTMGSPKLTFTPSQKDNGLDRDQALVVIHGEDAS